MVKRWFILVLPVCLGAGLVPGIAAQSGDPVRVSLTGVVVDSASGDPIVAARVRVLPGHA
ncbi:MAG: hypothetical protein L0271_23645 [Gemmatimonadetes bacterium]|nr:hypothetical protein [Gemmatimonadota bacterium]